MAYEVKDNTGSMFANDRKESANHPDGKGSAMIDGVEYWISSWNKKTAEGKPWRSLAFKRKEAAPQPTPAPRDKRFDAPLARQQPDRPDPRKGSGFDDFEDTPF
jgi:hypothetical protein